MSLIHPMMVVLTLTRLTNAFVNVKGSREKKRMKHKAGKGFSQKQTKKNYMKKKKTGIITQIFQVGNTFFTPITILPPSKSNFKITFLKTSTQDFKS